MEPEALLVALVFTVGMFCGVFVIFLAMRQRSEVLERQHRERMAMIERGQIPLPDQNVTVRRGSGASSRSLSLGIIVVGLGLGVDDHHQHGWGSADCLASASAAPS